MYVIKRRENRNISNMRRSYGNIGRNNFLVGKSAFPITTQNQLSAKYLTALIHFVSFHLVLR